MYEELLEHRLNLACQEYLRALRKGKRPSYAELEMKGRAQGLATALALFRNPNSGYGHTLDQAMEKAAGEL